MDNNTTLLTPEEQKRLVDAVCDALAQALIRFDSLCANIEHQNYLKNNPTKW